ncbi:sensor histidine kinase [Actinacidiphila glaucinigra]|uniref:sensor histidine kinase n=1 Tax=Actinacidiphila glaucinigra TaxID=235986 RepID=UPI00366F3267
MTHPLHEILASWSGRWRYPRLARAVHTGEPLDDPLVTRGILAGLAAPLSVTEGIEQLIADGELALVDDLLAEEDTAASVWTEIPAAARHRIEEALAGAHRNRRAAIDQETATLVERARRANLSLGSQPLTAGPADDIAAAFATTKRLVEEAEDALRAELLAETRSKALDPDHAAAVEACIVAGEFPTARQLLRSKVTDGYSGGPATVARPPLWDSALGRDLDVVLLHYRPNVRPPLPPHLARVTEVDSAGQEVVDTLRHLAAHLDAPTAGAFATALGRLLGEDVRSPVTALEDGFATTLVGLGDARLPGFRLTRRAGMPLWVAGPHTPPPAELARPVIWFVRDVGHPERTPPEAEGDGGTAVLTAAQLLALLARPARGTVRSTPTYRINLLRHLVPQLAHAQLTSPDDGIVLDSGAAPREALAWFLDLCGVAADAVVIDILLYETGGHPAVLREVLSRLLTPLPAHTRRLELRALDAIRSAGIREAVRRQALGTLDPEDRAVLGIAYTLHRAEPFGEDDLLTDLPLMGVTEEAGERVARQITPARSLSRLQTAGLLQRDKQTYTTLDSGLGALLAEGAETLAREALRELSERSEDAQAHARTALAEQAVATIGHRNDNIVAGVIGDLREVAQAADGQTRGMVDRLIDQVRQLSGEQYRQALEEYGQPPAPLDLDELTRSLTRRVEFNTGVRIRHFSDGPGPRQVHAVRSYIEISLENLLVNAVQAVRAAPPDLPLITMKVHTAQSGPEGEDGQWCVVDVEDNGPGLTAEERTVLLGGGEFSRHGSAGSGLRSARQMIRESGGTVDILTHSALGGAHLRVWLPCLTAPAGTPTPDASGPDGGEPPA